MVRDITKRGSRKDPQPLAKEAAKLDAFLMQFRRQLILEILGRCDFESCSGSSEMSAEKTAEEQGSKLRGASR